jgi:hypothetical protein
VQECISESVCAHERDRGREREREREMVGAVKAQDGKKGKYCSVGVVRVGGVGGVVVCVRMCFGNEGECREKGRVWERER